MEYLDSIKKIREIEEKYDVMTIKYRDMSVWPWLRIYLCDGLSVKKQQQEISSSNVKFVLKTLFTYNPLHLFSKHKIWTFSSQGGRKLIGNNVEHVVLGGISEIEQSTLNIEWADRTKRKYPQSRYKEKYLFPASWFLLLSHGIEVLFRCGIFKIEGKEIIDEILKDLGVDFDYVYFIRFLLAQKITMDFFLKVTYKPKVVVFLCPCTCMGFIWSLHKHNVPVVEMQHGVLNANHYAYNSRFHSKEFYPDQICVFGEDEYRYFTEENKSFCSDVVKTGSYVLEKSLLTFDKDIFESYREAYNTIVVVSGQTVYEKQMSSFVEEIAPINKDVLFVYIPRLSDEKLAFKFDNVIFRPGVNIYEYMKWCDIHMTISSTTCMEAQFFEKPTIFYDYDNLASTYYGNVFRRENGVCFIKNPSDFSTIKEFFCNGIFTYRDIYTHGHMCILKKVLHKYLEK